MKKFFLCQVYLSLVVVVAYPISLLRGFGGSSGVCYTMICVVLAAMWFAHLQKIEILLTIRPGLDLLPRFPVITSFVLSAVTFLIAKKSGASLPVGLTISGTVFFLSLLVVVEATLAMLVLIIVLAVGFGAPLAAALFFCLIMLVFAHALADIDTRARCRWEVFTGGLQAVAIYYFFIHSAKFFERRIMLN